MTIIEVLNIFSCDCGIKSAHDDANPLLISLNSDLNGVNPTLNATSVEKLPVTGIKMLVVDDDLPIRNILTEICRSLGMEVHSAQDGKEAWEIFQSVPFDIAIVDIYMPRMNGLVLLNNIKEANSDCQVILITGFLHYKQLAYSHKYRPDGFVPKPFKFEDIKKTIFRLLELQGKTEISN